jgi:hypothetical protein
MSMVETVIDAASMVLLVATGLSCLVLHHRLRGLRTERGELEAVVQALDAATHRAEAAAAGIREAAGEAQLLLARHGEEAEERIAELMRLTGAPASIPGRTAWQGAARTRPGGAALRDPRPAAAPATAAGASHGAKEAGRDAANGASRPAPKVDLGLIKALEGLR